MPLTLGVEILFAQVFSRYLFGEVYVLGNSCYRGRVVR